MEKMQIAIFDFDKQDCEHYVQLCRNIDKNYDGIEIEYRMYENAADLIQDMKNDDLCKILDVLFLKIESLEKNKKQMIGTEIAKKIRNTGYKGTIVFISSNSEVYYEDIFDVRAFNVVRRNSKNYVERFKNIFGDAVRYYKKKRSESIFLTCATESRVLNILDVKFFEVKDHIMHVIYLADSKTPEKDIKTAKDNNNHMNNKNAEFEFVSTLSRIYLQLEGKGFCKCQKSFLVNLNYVKKVTYTEITLKDDKIIPVGRKYYATFKETLKKWRK